MKRPRRLFRTRPPKGGASLLVVATRVGSVPDGFAIPPGYEVDSCHACGRAVWRCPEIREIGEALAIRRSCVCQECLADAPEPGPQPPPIPPGLDRLRRAPEAVDPGRTYGVETPDGTRQFFTGRELLATARGLTDLADAQRSGDIEAMRRALAALAGP
jgi:hypothetical protein